MGFKLAESTDIRELDCTIGRASEQKGADIKMYLPMHNVLTLEEKTNIIWFNCSAGGGAVFARLSPRRVSNNTDSHFLRQAIPSVLSLQSGPFPHRW